MPVVLPFHAAAERAAPPAPGPRPLGELLVEAGSLDPGRLARALDAQRGQDERIGRILLADGAISRDDLWFGLSRQSGLGVVDLAASPPDPLLLRGQDPYHCIALEALPWRQVGGTRVVAIANPANAE